MGSFAIVQALLSLTLESRPARWEADDLHGRFYPERMVGPEPFEPYTFRSARQDVRHHVAAL